MFNVIDLYAGAGGLSLGAARAGFNLVAAVELDPNAMKSHITNFPNTIHIQKDISTLTGRELLTLAKKPDSDTLGIIGGPPCQGFSSMGHGDVNDYRNSLFIKFFQIVSEVQPLFFLAENVPGIMKNKYEEIRAKAFNLVTNYDIFEPLLIDASLYGAATNRTRYFFIGFRKDLHVNIPKEKFSDAQLPEKERTTVEKAFEGLPLKIDIDKNKNGYRRIRSSYYSIQTRKQSDFFYNHMTGFIPTGVGDKEFIENYQMFHITNGFLVTRHSGEVKERYNGLKYGEQDKISKSQRLNPQKYCPTLRAGTGPDKGSFQAVRPIHYKEGRVIVPREAARLQGFPDWYKLPDTIWHSFRQIGNSVSPIAAEAVLKVLYDYCCEL